MDTLTRPTLLHAVLEKRQWLRFEVFQRQLKDAGARAAAHYRNPRLATVDTTKTTFKRWLVGEQAPRGDTVTVLEFWLGHSVQELLGPAPMRKVVLARVPHDVSLAAVHRFDVRFDSSHLSVNGPLPGAGGAWHLDGLRILDGTSVAVQMYEAEPRGDTVVIGPEDWEHLRYFTRARRRALLIAALGARGEDDLYVMDAAHARRQLLMPVDRLPIPGAYRLDELVYALLWAALNVDDSLLADDQALHVEQQRLEAHLAQLRSAAARAAYPDLTEVGAAWLGSHACATYLRRHLGPADAAPVLWSRVQYGGQAAGWLLFAERHQVLQLMQECSVGVEGTAGCVFGIPESAVKDSEPYERLLLLLAMALMESYGLTVHIHRERAHSDTAEFIIAPQHLAIVADWLSPDAVWHIDSTTSRSEINSLAHAVDQARSHSITSGRTPHERLRQAADYFDCDWNWLARRCRELSTYGIEGLLHLRSHLIQTGGIERALFFLGESAASR
ncbi:hypothetical protein [Streptomyces stelliscabiei]|uniref:hypothetical protein n=1 Tax=Streptomyces stelliscabiei TaxID=146820 RepID=UPI0029AF77F7|nr:hypothetical protein [Streptomyces stelliscabiei]MDX3435602.1 hypothetical protein [Streptomyces stelliscabiei]MDX3622099.1 hypothetical protein [Streptomyces stelliscabiei]